MLTDVWRTRACGHSKESAQLCTRRGTVRELARAPEKARWQAGLPAGRPSIRHAQRRRRAMPPAAACRWPSAGVPWTADGHGGAPPGLPLCGVLPRSPFKPSCDLLILRRDEKGQGEVWPAGQWWPRSAGRHSRSPLVPSGDGTGARGRRTRLGLQGNYVFGGFVKRGR